MNIETKHALIDLKEEINNERNTAITDERLMSRERIAKIKLEYDSQYMARKAILVDSLNDKED